LGQLQPGSCFNCNISSTAATTLSTKFGRVVRASKVFANHFKQFLHSDRPPIGMGIGKALYKFFIASRQPKEATETKRGPDAKQVHTQSTPSRQPLRTQNIVRTMRSATPAIPTLNDCRILSKECLRFDNAITKASLSHIMLWYTYWDVVEMPVRLGYEMDQFGLQSPQGIQRICAEMRIDVEDVRRRLTRMSKPKAMTKKEIAEYGMDVTVGAAFYKRKISKDRALIKGLQPEPHTRWARTQSQILDQLDLYQEILLQPAVQGVFLQQPGNLIAAKHRDKLHTDWDLLRQVRPVPFQSIYRQVLPPSDSDCGSVSKEPPSRPRFADKFPDEQHDITVNRNLNDSPIGSILPFDDLTNLVDSMNTQMMESLAALASTLMNRLSQLQDEIIGQVRDQWLQNLTSAMQLLQGANHASAETDGLSSASVVPNASPMAAQYPFLPPETQFENNF